MADEATSTETSAETVAANDAPDTAAASDDQGTALGGAGVEGDDGSTAEGDDQAQANGETAKEGEEAAKAEVPEAYELTFSEGFVADTATLEAATPILKDLGLTNEQAQSLVPVLEAHTTNVLNAAQQAQAELINAERANWLTSAKADPEIGGEKWDDTIVSAAKALDMVGFGKDSEFRKFLNESGLGNHPEMIRAFARFGTRVSEDNEFPRGGGMSPTKSREEILYPSMTKKDQ